MHYRSGDSEANSTPSTVQGIDKQARDDSVTAYHWRGNGLLKVSSTEWEVSPEPFVLLLRFKDDDEDKRLTNSAQVIGHGEGWAVTFFAKALFTPAGLDIYVREPSSMSDERLEDLVRTIQGLSGEVGELAKGFFEVPTSTGE